MYLLSPSEKEKKQKTFVKDVYNVPIQRESVRVKHAFLLINSCEWFKMAFLAAKSADRLVRIGVFDTSVVSQHGQSGDSTEWWQHPDTSVCYWSLPGRRIVICCRSFTFYYHYSEKHFQVPLKGTMWRMVRVVFFLLLKENFAVLDVVLWKIMLNKCRHFRI